MAIWKSGQLKSSRTRTPVLTEVVPLISGHSRHLDTFEVEPLSDAHQEELVAEMLREIDEGAALEKTGPHRKARWEEGWSENLNLLRKSSDIEVQALLPKYFRANQLQRFGDKLHRTSDLGFEPIFLSLLVDLVLAYELSQLRAFDKVEGYAVNNYHFAEFGCGTGHHLIRLLESRFLGNSRFTGLDWAESSQEIIRAYAKKTGNTSISGFNFDYFSPTLPIPWRSPDALKEISASTVFFTVASLEQIGTKHEAFIDFCLDLKPRMVIHFEPFSELLGDDPLGELSRRYFKARDYLQGYLDALEKREALGQLRIHSAERVGFGSLYTEGYSMVRWSAES